MEKIFVVPKTGLRVKDPASWQQLPEQGKWVPKNTYWRRRLTAGDVIEINKEIENETFSKEGAE